MRMVQHFTLFTITEGCGIDFQSLLSAFSKVQRPTILLFEISDAQNPYSIKIREATFAFTFFT